VDNGGTTAFAQAKELYARGETVAAKQLLEQAHRAAPEDRGVRFALAVCLNALGDWAGAEPHLRAVVEAEPHHHLAWFQLGCSLQAQARLQAAADAFREVLARTDDPEARRRLNECEAPHLTPRPVDAALAGQAVAQPGKAPSLARSIDREGVADEGQIVDRVNTVTRHLAPPAVVASVFTVIVLLSGGPPIARGIVLLGLVLFAAGAWVAVVLQARSNRFVFYQRRMDIEMGVLRQRRLTIWYYEIVSVRYVRGPVNLLTNSASIEVEYKPADHSVTLLLPGLGSPEQVHQIYQMLQRPRVHERRDMKGILT
jgi:tetratricopeptide (TPR) repeat protein